MIIKTEVKPVRFEAKTKKEVIDLALGRSLHMISKATNELKYFMFRVKRKNGVTKEDHSIYVYTLEKHKARRRYNKEGKFEVYKEAKYILYLYEFEPALILALNLKIRQRGDSFTITKGGSRSKLELVRV
jgi:hypothetical protein